MKIRKENCYIITGGPGVGKTTLVNELQKNGFNIVPENARVIIKQQIATNGEAVPWKNKELYADLMLKTTIEDYASIPIKSDITFFDRGIPDTLCYMDMIGYLSHPANLAGHQYQYNRNVFILPPWQEIYETDDERKQTWEEALLTYAKMKETYLKYNYDVIDVPRSTVDNRIEFLLSHLPNDNQH